MTQTRAEAEERLRNSTYSPDTLAIHADDPLNYTHTDVAPALHVSTTFRYSRDPTELNPLSDTDVPEAPNSLPPVYSRLAAPNTTRFEAILSSLLKGDALTYASGLAAFHALLVYLNPKVIAISGGYHGCHGVIDIMSKLTGLRKVDLHDESSWDAAGLGKGDVVHVETPLNPTGEAYSIQNFADLAHKRGAVLTIDSTFGPPGLQDPFQWGADYVMHSGTKYMGGHSDMLCGVLVMQSRKDFWGLYKERLFLGSVMGSLEGWLGVRSLRTLELRVQRQSINTEKLVLWLDGLLNGDSNDENAKVVKNTVLKVQHASLQKEDMAWLRKQMPNGYGPVFALWLKSREMAKTLPSRLHLFHHATSLGGVESLIEWRRMSDDTVDDRVMRISVGVENWEDLRDDIMEGLKSVAKETGAQTNGKLD